MRFKRVRELREPPPLDEEDEDNDEAYFQESGSKMLKVRRQQSPKKKARTNGLLFHFDIDIRNLQSLIASSLGSALEFRRVLASREEETEECEELLKKRNLLAELRQREHEKRELATLLEISEHELEAQTRNAKNELFEQKTKLQTEFEAQLADKEFQIDNQSQTIKDQKEALAARDKKIQDLDARLEKQLHKLEALDSQLEENRLQEEDRRERLLKQRDDDFTRLKKQHEQVLSERDKEIGRLKGRLDANAATAKEREARNRLEIEQRDEEILRLKEQNVTAQSNFHRQQRQQEARLRELEQQGGAAMQAMIRQSELQLIETQANREQLALQVEQYRKEIADKDELIHRLQQQAFRQQRESCSVELVELRDSRNQEKQLQHVDEKRHEEAIRALQALLNDQTVLAKQAEKERDDEKEECLRTLEQLKTMEAENTRLWSELNLRDLEIDSLQKQQAADHQRSTAARVNGEAASTPNGVESAKMVDEAERLLLRSQVEDRDDEINTLREQLRRKQAELEHVHLERQKGSITQNIETEVSKLQAALDDRTAEVSAFLQQREENSKAEDTTRGGARGEAPDSETDEVKHLRLENTRLTEEVSSLREQSAKFASRLAEAEQDLRRERAAAKNALLFEALKEERGHENTSPLEHEKREELECVHVELEGQQESAGSTRDKVNGLESAVSELQAADAYEAQAASLRRQLEDQINAREAEEKHRREREVEYESEIGRLRLDITNLGGELVSLPELSSKSAARREEESKELERNHAAAHDSLEAAARLQSELDERDGEINDLREEVSTKAIANEALVHRLDARDEEIKLLEERLENQAERLALAEAEASQVEQLQADALQYQRDVEDWNTKMEELLQRVGKGQQELLKEQEANKERLSTLSASLEESQRQTKQAESALDIEKEASSRSKSTAAALEAKCAKLSEQLEIRVAEIVKLRQELDDQILLLAKKESDSKRGLEELESGPSNVIKRDSKVDDLIRDCEQTRQELDQCRSDEERMRSLEAQEKANFKAEALQLAPKESRLLLEGRMDDAEILRIEERITHRLSSAATLNSVTLSPDGETEENIESHDSTGMAQADGVPLHQDLEDRADMETLPSPDPYPLRGDLMNESSDSATEACPTNVENADSETKEVANIPDLETPASSDESEIIMQLQSRLQLAMRQVDELRREKESNELEARRVQNLQAVAAQYRKDMEDRDHEIMKLQQEGVSQVALVRFLEGRTKKTQELTSKWKETCQLAHDAKRKCEASEPAISTASLDHACELPSVGKQPVEAVVEQAPEQVEPTEDSSRTSHEEPELEMPSSSTVTPAVTGEPDKLSTADVVGEELAFAGSKIVQQLQHESARSRRYIEERESYIWKLQQDITSQQDLLAELERRETQVRNLQASLTAAVEQAKKTELEAADLVRSTTEQAELDAAQYQVQLGNREAEIDKLRLEVKRLGTSNSTEDLLHKLVRREGEIQRLQKNLAVSKKKSQELQQEATRWKEEADERDVKIRKLQADKFAVKQKLEATEADCARKREEAEAKLRVTQQEMQSRFRLSI